MGEKGGGREGEGNRLASAEEKGKGKGVRRMSLLFGRPTFCLSSAQLRDCTGKRKEIPPRYKTPLSPFPACYKRRNERIYIAARERAEGGIKVCVCVREREWVVAWGDRSEGRGGRQVDGLA